MSNKYRYDRWCHHGAVISLCRCLAAAYSPRVIFGRQVCKLGLGLVRELDVDVIPDIADDRATIDVLDFTNKVDQRVIYAVPLGECQFMTGYLDNERHKVFCAVELKVVELHRDGQVSEWIVEHKSVFQLALFLGSDELVELLRSVISLTIIKPREHGSADCNLDAAEATIRRRIRRIVAQYVIVGYGLLCLRTSACQVVIVE